ncbi:hypothetical protein ACUOFU_16915 [Microbacterium arabinogalactanolyticum]|uniref:hypothetical protein n=1 Tax=Microbacterium arabinogalactanolyticum TaxID=69365 RepID=UPI00404443BE
MTIRTLVPNPPISKAIQRTTSNDAEVLAFVEERGILSPRFLTESNDPDLLANGDEPVWMTIHVPVGDWVVATPAGIGTYTFAGMPTAELEARFHDPFTG